MHSKLLAGTRKTFCVYRSSRHGHVLFYNEVTPTLSRFLSKLFQSHLIPRNRGLRQNLGEVYKRKRLDGSKLSFVTEWKPQWNRFQKIYIYIIYFRFRQFQNGRLKHYKRKISNLTYGVITKNFKNIFWTDSKVFTLKPQIWKNKTRTQPTVYATWVKIQQRFFFTSLANNIWNSGAPKKLFRYQLSFER